MTNPWQDQIVLRSLLNCQFIRKDHLQQVQTANNAVTVIENINLDEDRKIPIDNRKEF